MDDSSKDFEEYISEINNSSCSIEHENKKIIVLVLVDDNQKAKFQIYTEDKIWIDTLGLNQFQLYKKQMGFDGGWKPFFQTMKLALNRIQGGNVSITKMPKTKKEDLVIKLSHPLSEDFKISGEIKFSETTLTTPNCIDFNEKAFQICFDLFTSNNFKHLNEKLNHTNNSNNALHSKSNITSSLGSNSTNSMDPSKNLKRKFVSNLVNPNQKKSKIRGAKFGNDDTEEKEKSDA